MYIYKFTPFLKPVLWGGDKISRLKGVPTGAEPIGESWELSAMTGHESVVAEGPEKGSTLSDLVKRHREALMGERVYRDNGDVFPLLIKFIDARSNLSIQVHPGDDLARERHGCAGKTEMWYILETEGDAEIYAGLSRAITPADYERMVADNTIMDAVAVHRSRPGDMFFIPPGCIHSIGAGNLLVEIQQASDITYRVYDYDRRDANGRPRELHTLQARDAIDYEGGAACPLDYDRDAAMTTLVDCGYFTANRHVVDGEMSLPVSGDSFVAVVNLGGDVTIEAPGLDSCTLRPYETALIPASARDVKISGHSTLLTATA